MKKSQARLSASAAAKETEKAVTYSPEVVAEAQRQLDIIRRGANELLPEDLLFEKLKRSIANRKPLRVKLGCDPSRPDLHLGHSVVFNKLKAFQELGHQVIFLIGDFTAMIGDPTGKSETRQPLTREDVQRNAKTYAEQIFRFLNRNKTQIVFNSHWTDKLKIDDMIRLASQVTVARMLERDDFEKRYREQQPIALHEFFYPLLQGNDSVELRADIELGGTDQKFNLLMGRELQKAVGQEPQVILTMPILEGLDGAQKMSKSLGNTICVEDTPKEMFGKVMSISDTLMLRYYDLLTDFELLTIKAMHPKQAKVQLASYIVETYHGKDAAEKAIEEFDALFAKKEIPDDIPVVTHAHTQISLTKALVDYKLCSSLSEARRLIAQGGVKVNGEKIEDTSFAISGMEEAIIKAGKRKFLKIKFGRNA